MATVTLAKYTFDNTIGDVLPSVTPNTIEMTYTDTVDDNITTREVFIDNSNVVTQIKFENNPTALLTCNYVRINNQITSMSTMFMNCENLKSINTSNWDTQNVTHMESTFIACKSLTELDVSNFNVSSVLVMKGMFQGCSSLTSLDLSSWNTSSVTSMRHMFQGCYALTNLNVSNFNTNKVQDFEGMFQNCTSIKSLNLSSWNTSKAYYMQYMFESCSKLEQLNISSWDTSSVTHMTVMFGSCTSLKVLDLTSFNTNSTSQYISMFQHMTSDQIVYTNANLWTLDTSSYDATFVSLAGRLITSYKYNSDLYADLVPEFTGLETSQYTTSDLDTNSTTEIDTSAWVLGRLNTQTGEVVADSIYYRSDYIEVLPNVRYNFGVTFNMCFYDGNKQFISGINNSSVATAPSNAKYIRVDRSAKPTVFTMTTIGLITRAIASDTLPTMIRFGKTSTSDGNPTDATLSLLEVLEMNTSNITDMSFMFRLCQNLTAINTEINTSKVTQMQYAFCDCDSITSINVSNWDTSQVTDMGYMFTSCSSLTSLDVSNFDTSQVTDMQQMFYSCSSLTSLDVSNFNTSQVTNMRGMFYGCSSLSSIDVSNFNTSQVTNIQDMFYCCYSLTFLDVSKWNTSNVTTMLNTFASCRMLKELDLSSFNTKKLGNMYGTFYGCHALENLDISNFDINNVSNFTTVFTGSSKLMNIGMIYCNSSTINKISSLITTNTTIYYHDANLSELTQQNNITYEYYNKSTATLPYELNKLPNGVADYIDVVNGVYVQRVGKRVFNGSENWINFQVAGDTRAYRTNLEDALDTLTNSTDIGSVALCDKIPLVVYNTLWGVNKDKLCGAINKSNATSIVSFYIYHPTVTNDTSYIKEMLASSSVTLLYELATPIYTPLTDEEKALLPLSAYSNGYVQLSSDELRPSKFEFRAKSNNRLQLDMLETGHYYLNASTGNIKLGDVDIDVTEMPCLIKVNNASNKRLIADGGTINYNGGTIDYNLDINSEKGYLLDSGQVTVGTGRDRASDYIKINNRIIILQVINVSNITSWRYSIAYYDENKIAIQTTLDIYLTQEKTIITSIPNNAVYCRISMQIANIIASNSNAMITISTSAPITLSKLPSHRIPTTFTQGMKSSVDFGYWQGVKEAKASYVRTINPTDWGEISRINFGNGIELYSITGKYGTIVTVEDEIDISTGKYTKRVGKYVIDGTVTPYGYLEHKEEYNIQKVDFLLSKTGIKPKKRFDNNTYGLAITDSLKFRVDYALNEPHIFIDKNCIKLFFKAGTFGAFTLENVQNYFKENPMTVYYELETPEITYLDLTDYKTKTVDTSTVLQGQRYSVDYLFPQCKPAPLSYPTTLSPNTQYTVFHNRKNYNGSVKTPMINLGGAEVSATGSRTVVTTPSTLAHNELQFIGGENTVEQVMVLHGDWTKEGKTVDYFEGLQSSVIGDKTLENLVDEPIEIWSNKVTSNGSAVDYVSMDNIIAVGYENRPKLPEVQVDTNVRSHGMTLQNLAVAHECIAEPNAYVRAEVYDGVLPVGTYIFFYNVVEPNPTIQSSGVERFTPYYTCQDGSTYYEGWETHNQTTGLKYWKFTVTSPITMFRFWIANIDANCSANNFMLLQYQQGMENWNIPFFEGMKSVENPVYYSVGKNLFDGEMELGSIITRSGEPEPSDVCLRSVNFIKVRPSTTYKITNDLGYTTALYEYDSNFNYIENKTYSKVYTSSEQTAYIKIKTSASKVETDLNVKYQIEQGTQGTEYEPYKENILSTPQGTVLRGIGSYKDVIGWNDGIIRRNCVEFTISGEEGYEWKNTTEKTNTIKANLSLTLLGLENKIPQGNSVNGLICDKIPWHYTDSDFVHIRVDGNNPALVLVIYLDKTKFSTYTSQGINDYIKSIGGLTIIAPLVDTGYEDVTFTNDYSNVDEEYQVGKPLIFNHGTLYTTTDTHPSTFLDFSLKTTNRYAVKDFDKLKYTVLTEQPFYFNGVDYPASPTGMTIIDVTGIADSSIYSDDTMITVVQDDGNYYADGVLTQFKGEKTFVKEFIRTSNDTYNTGMTLLEPLELNGLPNGVKDEYNPVTGEIIRNIGVIDVIPENLQGFENNGVTSKAYLYDTRLKDRNTAQIAALGVLSNNFSPIDNASVYTYGVVGATNNFPVWFSLENTITTLEDFQLWFREHPQILLYQLATPQIIQATPTSTYISTRPENGNIIAQDTQIQAEYLNYDNEQSIISPRMLGDGDEIRWELGSQCYVYENDNEYIPLTEYNELFGANLQAQEYTQYAESVDGADIEVGVALKEKAVYEQTYVKYEDNIVYPTTMENIDETNGVEVDYICGATWQNPNDLSDIRHLGELREDGQYDVTIRRSGDDEIRLLEGTTHIGLDYDVLPPSEFELTFFNNGGVEVGKYGDTNHTLEDCVQDSKLTSSTVYGQNLANLATKNTTIGNSSPTAPQVVINESNITITLTQNNQTQTVTCEMAYTLKQNTKYMIVGNVTTSTANHASNYLASYVLQWHLDNVYKGEAELVNNLRNQVFTTGADYNRTSLICYARGFVGSVTFDYPIILEYQDGMENWNIPYFEGMKSTVVNGFSSCGKNLWNGDQDLVVATPSNNVVGVFTKDFTLPKGKYYATGIQSTMYNTPAHIKLYSDTASRSVDIPLNRTDYYMNVNFDVEKITVYANGYQYQSSLDKELTIKNFMISRIEDGLEYEPPKTINYYLPTPITLRKAGDVCDTFDVVSGVETRNTYLLDTTTLLTQNKPVGTSDSYPDVLGMTMETGQSIKFMNGSISTNGMKVYNEDVCEGAAPRKNEECIGYYYNNSSKTMALKIIVKKQTLINAGYSADATGLVSWFNENPFAITAQLVTPIKTQHTLIPSTTQTTQEPTFILPQPLRSVPNGICDRLYWDENKGHYCIEKRIGKFVMDGNCKYTIRGRHDSTTTFQTNLSIPGAALGEIATTIWTYPLPYSQNSSDGIIGLGMTNNTQQVYIELSTSVASTLDECKTYLTNNPQTLYYVNGDEIIDLPHLNEKVELPTQPNIYPIGYKAVHDKVNPEIGLTIPYKVLNMPTQPVNLNFVMDIADYVLTWDDVKEARQYNIILNDEVIATVKEPQYNTGEEMYGYILVEANNEIGDNLSEELYIKTVPNAPAQLTVAHNPLTDHYDFEISFIDTSDIADYYTVMYKVDGGEWVINTIQNSELTTGEKHLWSFSVYEIKESIEVWATATNDVGTNDILPTAIYYMSPTPQWTYRINSKDVFLRWIDESPYDTKYKLRYSYKSNGQYQYAYFEGDAAEIGKLYEAVLPLAEDDEVTLALCIVSEKENLYCKPVKASKPLDPNIVPPMNFNYHWLARGLIEFYWEDQYDVDVEYEYILESMKANETLWTQVNEIIPSEDVEGTGTVYRVEYQLEDLEQIRMKVRMKWAMNETEWTETLTTVFIPVEGNPPTYIRRTQTAEGLLIEWEAQAYIDSYHIYVIDNETGEELQHLETSDNSILVDLDYSNSIEIAIYEISRFSGGIESDPTDPMVFTPTMFATDIEQRIYQPCAEEYPIEVSTVQKGNKQAYVIHDISYTPNVETEHEVGIAISSPFQISYHPMMVDVHQAGSRDEHAINAHIKTLDVRSEDLIRVMTFERTQETYDMNFTVYTPSVASYPINLEVSKVRIVCLGDSLTSGRKLSKSN